MPTPRLPATHHSTKATARAGQLNMKSAAIAPTWKMTIVIEVGQLIAMSSPLSSNAVALSMNPPLLLDNRAAVNLTRALIT
ncbi:MAG: hypothetical protein LC785_15300 [Acidobacteria bacterium]|nr:hypothetical protein [Acidobacteriota bacterium]